MLLEESGCVLVKDAPDRKVWKRENTYSTDTYVFTKVDSVWYAGTRTEVVDLMDGGTHEVPTMLTSHTCAMIQEYLQALIRGEVA